MITGIGINKAMVNKIFQLDAWTKRPGTDNEPGSGPGLLLCEEFIGKQGGKIWAESEEGEGRVFFIIISCK
jgi:signal transduction histidine kinase